MNVKTCHTMYQVLVRGDRFGVPALRQQVLGASKGMYVCICCGICPSLAVSELCPATSIRWSVVWFLISYIGKR